jgi:two-component system, chemotaxis family, chemotaxis protein CheY
VATILVVDDDANNRLLVQTVLEHAGHHVLEAGDGAPGLALAASERPDLIMLDLSLPSMSGPQFLRALREDPQTQTLLVALYTASPVTAVLSEFMEIYGVAGVIPKPCEPIVLAGAVERALEAGRSRDEKKL